MKRLLAILLITAAAFSGCKKEEQSNGEFYKMHYSTIKGVMDIVITGNNPINWDNVSRLGFTSDSPIAVAATVPDAASFDNAFTVEYRIHTLDAKQISFDFKKLDGSIKTLEFKNSDQIVNMSF